MTLTTFLAFLLAQTLAAAVPGPTVMPVISQAMRFGWKRSLFGTIGVCSANIILVTASAVGLAAILLANAQLFEIVKWIGVAYLLFFGALLPQFVNVPAGNVSLQFFILGSMVIVIELLVLWFYGWAADQSARLLPHGKAIQYQNRAAGLVLISAGIWFATLKR